MNKFFKKPILYFFLLVCFLKPHVQAENLDFSFTYDFYYEVQKTGFVRVTQKIIITNLEEDVIPKKYTLSYKKYDMKNIKAVINGRETDPVVNHKDTETEINVALNRYAVGKGRQNMITIYYDTENIAYKTGKVWVVYIPKVNIPANTTLYNIRLSVPEDFGPKIFISPEPSISEKENEKNIYYFTKEEIEDSSITASFGEYQILNFKIKYQIKNPGILSAIHKIALPPDIRGVQQVKYQSILPKPKDIEIDGDGNAMAVYKLGPKSEKEIELSGSAKILGRQINPSFGRHFEDLPESLVEKYTEKQQYWEVDSPRIANLANELKNENENIIKNAGKVYDYVVENLVYDFEALEKDRVERHGAETALTEKGYWTCTEFTDLFIALTRAMGIPSREINGYAFTTDETERPLSISIKGGDLLHSWAEFYDPSYGWIQVDPTWGSTSGIDYFTKLDTNHFAFVVRGLSSQYPYPAGDYRYNDNEKLVEVDYADNFSESGFETSVSYKKAFSLNLIKLFKGLKKYKITNTGGVFIYLEDGNILAPGESIKHFFDKDNPVFKYHNFEGVLIEKNLTD